MKFVALVFLFASCFGHNKIVTKNEVMDTNTSKIPSESLYDIKINTLDGKPVNLSKYKGKKLLIVNTASECGYTPQYAELQKLHETYADKIVVLGFPCNDFGGQEPGSHQEIQQFCQKNYGVTFDLFEKVHVKGKEIHPLFQWLTDKNKNGWNSQEPTWNFCKYLINEKGELVKFYASNVKPLGKEIQEAIQ